MRVCVCLSVCAAADFALIFKKLNSKIFVCLLNKTLRRFFLTKACLLNYATHADAQARAYKQIHLAMPFVVFATVTGSR